MSLSSSSRRSSQSRKRQTSIELPQVPKRRRSARSIQRMCMDISTSSADSFIKYDDTETSVNTVSFTSENCESESSVTSKIASLASKYNIKLGTVKKYYSILTSSPQVPIIRTVAIKKELDPYIAPTLSPVFGSKKRLRKRKVIVPKCEIVSTTENVNTRLSKNLDEYFKTLESVKIKEEIISSPEKSKNPNISLNNSQLSISKSNTQLTTRKGWISLCDSSGDEFSGFITPKTENFVKTEPKIEKFINNESQTNKFNKNESKIDRNRTLLSNPFSKVKSKKLKNVQNLENKKSFWTNIKQTYQTGGDINPASKKKKIMETFKIKNKKSINVHVDSDDDVIFVNSRPLHTLKKENIVKTEKIRKKQKCLVNKEIKLKKKEKYSTIQNNLSNGDATLDSSNDSLSVNFQELFNLSSIKMKNTDETVTNCNQNLPISFGDIQFENEQLINFQKDTYALNSNAVEKIPENAGVTVNNIKEQQKVLNNNVDIVDLFDSPTKLDYEYVPEINNIDNFPLDPQRNENKDISKTTPLIISDNNLENFSMPLPTLEKKHDKRDSLPSKDCLTVPNRLETPSSKSVAPISNDKTAANISNTDCSLLIEFNSNGEMKNITNLKNAQSTTFSTSLLLVRPDPNVSNSIINQDQPIKSNQVDSSNVEESFDSLCQDVSKLSSAESITLYKGGLTDDSNQANQKDTLRNSPLQSSGSRSSIQISNNVSNISSNKEVMTKRKPVTLQHNPRNVLNSNSSSVGSSQASTVVPTKVPVNSQQLANVLKISAAKNGNPQVRMCRLRSSTAASTSVLNDTRLNKSFNSVMTKKSSYERDPRLNRSLSPMKLSNVISKESPLIRSNERTTTTVMDTQPKHRASINTIDIQHSQKHIDETSNIVDPRLRKRKEREIAEKYSQIEAEKTKEKENDDIIFLVPEDVHTTQTSTKRSSVFHRLGFKQDTSPRKKDNVVPNELLSVVQSKNRSPEKNMNYDSDDDGLTLHPCELFSSDEESNASPRHRKFTSERTRIGDISKHLPMSLKNRLNWSASSNRNTSQATPSTTKPGILSRLTLNKKVNNQRQIIQQHKPLMQIDTTKFQQMNMSEIRSKEIDPKTSDHEFSINNATFNEKFYKMNAAQMLMDVNNLRTDELESNTYVSFGNGDTEISTQYDHISILNGPSEPVQIGAGDGKTTFFKSYCFKILRKGTCYQETSCNFSHKTMFLSKLLRQKQPDALMFILNDAIQNNFESFLVNVWSSVLPILQNESFTMYEKLYQGKLRSEKFIHDLLEFCLRTKLHTAESFIKRISFIVEKGDRDTVRIICTAIKSKLTDGFCWEAIKELAQKAVPPRDMIELTVLQCLKRKKNQNHINEVYDLVKNKMNVLERNMMSQTMLKQFYNLVKSKDLLSKKEALNTLPLMNITSDSKVTSSKQIQVRNSSIESVHSNSPENEKQITKTHDNVQQPNGSPLEVGATTPNKGESTNFTEYKLKKNDITEATSPFRDRFWRLFVAVNGVKQALKHIDYKFVWKTMDEFSKEFINEPDELVRRAYYNILCKDVKRCERHITEIIKEAVRCRGPTSQKSMQLLFETGVLALITLADSELWVMALQLLSSIKFLESDEPKTAFVLISAEIYLANNDPLEALYLLQKTRLIRTNRDEWLTNDSKKDDERHRNKLVNILLKALSYADVEKAVYLFKALLVDQYISYFPIDLSLHLDNLMLLLLLNNKEELAADISRLVMDNDLTLQKSTYRELIRCMIPFDEILANQILEYAIHLGYYNDVQIKTGYTTLIIDMNSSEEEIYLILKRLIHKITVNIGPVIHHLKPNQIKIILIFEDVPNDKRLYRNEIAIRNASKYTNFRNLIVTMLAKRFTPSIRIVRGKADKFCKIISRTFVDYLKYWN